MRCCMAMDGYGQDTGGIPSLTTDSDSIDQLMRFMIIGTLLTCFAHTITPVYSCRVRVASFPAIMECTRSSFEYAPVTSPSQAVSMKTT